MAQLFRGHGARLFRVVARQVRDPSVAEDIVQDVFSRAISRGSVGSPVEDTRMLYASARNAAIDHLRHENRRRTLVAGLLPAQLHMLPIQPEKQLEDSQTLSVLELALEELSPRCRDIFLLRRVHGLSNAEIARRHGISVSAVEKHIMRAMRQIQKAMESMGGQ